MTDTQEKYILKNCPALYGDEYCKEYTYEDGSVSCAKRNDCALKKIINKCLEMQNESIIMQNFTISMLNAFDLEVVKND